MMYLEFDWAFSVYRPRFGDSFTDIDGYRSFADLAEARYVLRSCKLALGSKTDSCTWRIVNAAEG